MLVLGLQYASHFDCVLICGEWQLHELIEAPNCYHWQDVHGEQGHVRNITIVVFHQHGGNQTASVLHAIVE